MRAIIQAGGKGQRLLPYTRVLPKPLLPVADLPIIEIVIRQLVQQGFDSITISVGHLANLIRAVVESRHDWSVEITFVEEERPLGTIGPVTLLEDVDEPFLVMNGDILTDFDAGRFLAAHIACGGQLSVATYRKIVPISLGVFDLDHDGRVSGFREKPTLQFACSMGIYAFSPEILEYIPRAAQFGFDDLMELCLARGLEVRTQHHDGFWLDIGRHEDYEAATDQFLEHRDRLLTTHAYATNGH